MYLMVHITKLVNNKKEKRTLLVLLGKGLKKKCMNRTPKQISTCRNLTLAKCGGEAQHSQSWGFGVTTPLWQSVGV